MLVVGAVLSREYSRWPRGTRRPDSPPRFHRRLVAAVTRRILSRHRPHALPTAIVDAFRLAVCRASAQGRPVLRTNRVDAHGLGVDNSRNPPLSMSLSMTASTVNLLRGEIHRCASREHDQALFLTRPANERPASPRTECRCPQTIARQLHRPHRCRLPSSLAPSAFTIVTVAPGRFAAGAGASPPAPPHSTRSDSAVVQGVVIARGVCGDAVRSLQDGFDVAQIHLARDASLVCESCA